MSIHPMAYISGAEVYSKLRDIQLMALDETRENYNRILDFMNKITKSKAESFQDIKAFSLTTKRAYREVESHGEDLCEKMGVEYDVDMAPSKCVRGLLKKIGYKLVKVKKEDPAMYIISKK